MNKNCFVSWSGGKDSCLACYKAIQMGYTPKKLLTMFNTESGVSAAHRQKEAVFKAQAVMLGIEGLVVKTPFQQYEETFVEILKILKNEGIDYGVFGDIDFEPHREWVTRVCEQASMQAVLPLWQSGSEQLVQEFIDLGFKAKIVLVDTQRLDTSFLGLDLTTGVVEKIKGYGADACGENGEYHTLVYDGPLFNKPLMLRDDGKIIQIEDHWAQIEVYV